MKLESRDIFIVCPACGTSCRVNFPQSFFLNDAEIKCCCGYRARAAEMSSGEAVEELIKIVEWESGRRKKLEFDPETGAEVFK